MLENLTCLFSPLDALDEFSALTEALCRPGAVMACGLDDAQKLHLMAAVARRLGRPLLYVTSNEVAAQRVAEDLGTLLGGNVALLPARDISFLRTTASSRELRMRRIEALGAAATGEARALVAPADALLCRLAPRERFVENVVEITPEMRVSPTELIAHLTAAGYERASLVEARGQCALRGGILDVYPVGMPGAVRLEFFDDEVDSLRSFDVMTQRSTSRLERARIYPASETLLRDEECLRAAHALKTLVARRAGALRGEGRQKRLEREFGLIPFEDFLKLTGEGEDEGAANARSAVSRNFHAALDALEAGRDFDGSDALTPVLAGFSASVIDYLNDPILVFDQPARLRERAENRLLEFREHFAAALEHDEALPAQAELLFSWEEALARADGRRTAILYPFLRTDEDFHPKAVVQFEGRNTSGYMGNIPELARDLTAWQRDGWRVALLAGGAARSKRLQSALEKQGLRAQAPEQTPEALPEGEMTILPMTLSRGFLYPGARLAVVCETDIFGVGRQKSRSRARSGEKIAAFTDLAVGDYVVHENHGVGQYMGTVRLASEGTYRDFLHIRYQGADKLYVPTDQLDRVQKYIGSEGETPKLNRLSGGEWQRQKARVKASIQEIAGELLRLYAHRESAPGHAFDPDTPWQREFEDSFPFEETPDQLAAIEEIKRDMEKPRIMDRLLCGDVGYGKTEVALRAIFKCVMGGKQAALLAPTTILVQQHYATMMNRFHGFPIKVETLSRFKTAQEQKEVLRRLEAGELDVVIGTHRLLGKDVNFKDLGLLVVDEEQRFGVTHKEAIKKIKRTVDVLTLTATPIPRTLHMSMVGIRDMSLLQSPPEERYPVQTYVVEYSDGLVRDAILREIGRGGQVYVLNNRVQTIDAVFTRLKKLVPEARIAIGHGQMREHALEDVMLDFYEGKFDVLLCTTIIEAGLDVPRANTLIVLDADRFGLAQLYQLRGRVGRSNRLAYAYLTVNPAKVLTEAADKRLGAIREFTEFGSGFRVAMRDLEIRGAGNLLGAEQSGFMASVGYDLYVKMIEEAVREMRGDVQRGDVETRVELKVDAYLPQEYVPSDAMRVEMYKKIASIRDRAGREDLVEELIDRFGDPNRPVMNLIETAHLKALCSQLGIDNVSMKGGEMVLRFSIAAQLDALKLLAAVKPHEARLRLVGTNPPALRLFDPARKTAEELLPEAVRVMEDIVGSMAAEAEQPAEEGEDAKEVSRP